MEENLFKAAEWSFLKLLGMIPKCISVCPNGHMEVLKNDLKALKLESELLSDVKVEVEKEIIRSLVDYKYPKFLSVWVEHAKRIESEANEILILDDETVISRIKSKDLLNMHHKIIDHLKKSLVKQEMICYRLYEISLKTCGSIAEAEKKSPVLEKPKKIQIQKAKRLTYAFSGMEEE